MPKIVIEDELHAELQGEFSDVAGAVAELKRRAQIPWDKEPNLAPCSSWRRCGRIYEVVVYDDSAPLKELSRVRALEIDASGTKWASGFSERWMFISGNETLLDLRQHKFYSKSRPPK